jgi:alkylation response protein AidB-like acyl-CoA dehydrogenase
MTDADVVATSLDELLAAHPPSRTDRPTFLGAQYDRGLAWVQFDHGCGGLGLSPQFQRVIDERLAAAGAPPAFLANPLGHGMGAPTVYTWGSEALKQRYLRPLFTGEEIWCQLFSEPGAGSDVASLATRAVRDGDEWVINGQKVWTTLGHLASFAMLVARTDPETPKHSGMSYFVCDMHAPGVEVRPLRQMTGDAEFNEVYLTDVRIPDGHMLGRPGDGWRVTLTTLMNERVMLGGRAAPRGSGHIAKAVALYGQLPPEQRNGANRDELMRLWNRAEVARLTSMRASEVATRGNPGPEGAVGKLAEALNNKDITSFCMNLMGADAMLFDDYTMRRPTLEEEMNHTTFQKTFLRARANSIEGGTSEIMRNILAERVLGLPGDVRVDKDPPWSQVPRN